jgi:hypothetical protein
MIKKDKPIRVVYLPGLILRRLESGRKTAGRSGTRRKPIS